MMRMFTCPCNDERQKTARDTHSHIHINTPTDTHNTHRQTHTFFCFAGNLSNHQCHVNQSCVKNTLTRQVKYEAQKPSQQRSSLAKRATPMRTTKKNKSHTHTDTRGQAANRSQARRMTKSSCRTQSRPTRNARMPGIPAWHSGSAWNA